MDTVLEPGAPFKIRRCNRTAAEYFDVLISGLFTCNRQ